MGFGFTYVTTCDSPARLRRGRCTSGGDCLKAEAANVARAAVMMTPELDGVTAGVKIGVEIADTVVLVDVRRAPLLGPLCEQVAVDVVVVTRLVHEGRGGGEGGSGGRCCCCCCVVLSSSFAATELPPAIRLPGWLRLITAPGVT